LKAAGIIAALEKFETFFGLKLGYLLFSAAEETSKVLQNKDRTLQEAVSAVNLTQAFYQRQRNDYEFDRLMRLLRWKLENQNYQDTGSYQQDLMMVNPTNSESQKHIFIKFIMKLVTF